jgi:preprotein translocase subunit SecD
MRPDTVSESLTRSEEAAADLERVSREHLGQTVALVVDGEVVTMHKIRSVISDGKVQVTRCTDNACQYLYTRLTKER